MDHESECSLSLRNMLYPFDSKRRLYSTIDQYFELKM